MERDGRPNAPRLVVLTVLLVLLGFFVERQTGSMIGSRALTAFNAALVPLLGTIWAIAYREDGDGKGGAGLKDKLWAKARALLAFGTRPGPLVGLGVTYGLLASHCSAVVVRLEERDASHTVTLEGLESVSLDRDQSEAIVPCWTLLAGRSYEVKVTGFEPHTVSVGPWGRTTVRVPGDLTAEPVLLVRAPSSKSGVVDNAQIELVRLDVDGRESQVRDPISLAAHRLSVTYGPRRPIPEALVRRFEIELLRETPDLGASWAVAADWEHPLGTAGEPLERGDELIARLRNLNSDKVTAERSFSFLPDERGWCDVLLLEL